MSQTAPPRRGLRSAWDWFPWAIAGALALVIAVNAGMIWAAIATFPGQAGPDGFDFSNGYNRLLRVAARQQALGWRVTRRIDAADRLTLRLVGPDGAALAGATAEARAERPIGPRETRRFALIRIAPGRFRAAVPLPRGQWLIRLTLRAGGHVFREERRMIVSARRKPAS